jgi:transcriptional regulator with XRE-family HTH domain
MKMSKYKTQIIKALTANIKALGYTQQDIADHLGVTLPTVGKILSGKFAAKLPYIEAMADMMGLQLALVPKGLTDATIDGHEDDTERFMFTSNLKGDREYLMHTVTPLTLLELTGGVMKIVECEFVREGGIEGIEDGVAKAEVMKVIVDATNYMRLVAPSKINTC